jgi:uncharacterized RDD family membrane protein YckC
LVPLPRRKRDVSSTPPENPWDNPGFGDQPPPPPPPPGGYPPPPPAWEQPPSVGGGYPAPPPSWQQPPPQGSYHGGESPAPGGQLAGWWLRVGATVVDFLVLLVPNAILRAVGGNGGGYFLSVVLDAAYITLMLSRRGRTVGNMAVHTRVVDSRTGGPISTGKALGRWASEFVLFLLLIVPGILDLLWPLWDRENQTLHDKMAGTVVLRDQ